MIHDKRVRILGKGSALAGEYILYWMQASQRVTFNHALEFAVREANKKRLPLIVYFGITPDYPEANLRHYTFMLDGLCEVKKNLEKIGVKMIIRLESPEKGVVKAASRAALTVFDVGYTRIQKAWRISAAEKINCPVVQVETDVVVPSAEASPKEEYAASTFRPKISRLLDEFMVPLKHSTPLKSSLGMDMESETPEHIIKKLRVKAIPVSPVFKGGSAEAEKHLKLFLDHRLEHFEDLRNDPSLDYNSNLSPYIHFGQISPLYIALKAREKQTRGTAAFLEELIVRRELAVNFVDRNPAYDDISCLDAWQRKTLAEHSRDKREYIYSMDDFEKAETHDPYWNAAQKEMLINGKMHGYMRMYWGKKIIEWAPSHEDAFKWALYLNNKYELDGRDPNAFTGVAWCFGKHDRPWQERSIFGKIRYMNDKGLERKFDISAYCKKIQSLGNPRSSGA